MKRRIPTINEFMNENNVLGNMNENENHIKVLQSNFGGYDDFEFLKIIWHMNISSLEELLRKCEDDLKWLNKNSKGILGPFNRRDIQYIKNRIKYIKEVIASKKKNPDYIPAHYLK